MKHRILLATAVVIAASVTPEMSHAIESCRVKVSTADGTLLVSAGNVVGRLRWGAAPGGETLVFSNVGTCLVGGKAKKCELGPTGSLERITPPENCRLFLADDAPSTCAAYIKGCTPGLRSASAVVVGPPGQRGPQGPAGAQGAQGPQGPTGPQGPSFLIAAARILANGALDSASAAPGISVSSVRSSAGLHRLTLSGTGAFAGMAARNVIINSTANSNNFEATNAFVDSINANQLVVGIFNWRTSDEVFTEDAVFVTVFRGN